MRFFSVSHITHERQTLFKSGLSFLFLQLVLPVDLDQLDLEDEDSVPGDLGRGAGGAVPELGGDHQLALLALAHAARRKKRKEKQSLKNEWEIGCWDFITLAAPGPTP